MINKQILQLFGSLLLIGLVSVANGQSFGVPIAGTQPLEFTSGTYPTRYDSGTLEVYSDGSMYLTKSYREQLTTLPAVICSAFHPGYDCQGNKLPPSPEERIKALEKKVEELTKLLNEKHPYSSGHPDGHK